MRSARAIYARLPEPRSTALLSLTRRTRFPRLTQSRISAFVRMKGSAWPVSRNQALDLSRSSGCWSLFTIINTLLPFWLVHQESSGARGWMESSIASESFNGGSAGGRTRLSRMRILCHTPGTGATPKISELPEPPVLAPAVYPSTSGAAGGHAR